MRERKQIVNSFEVGESNGVLDAVAPELILEVLLDIRDLLVQIRDREHVVDFVPPDYGKEDVLVGSGQWKCRGCGSVLSEGTRHRCPGPCRQR